MNAIVLLPSEASTKAFNQLSKEISKSVKNEVILGNNAVAHITIAQTEMPIEELKEIVANLKWDNEHSLEPLGIAMKYENGTWIDIAIIPDKKIVKLHEDTCLEIKRRGYIVNNKHGVFYRPHVTLCFSHKDVQEIPFMNPFLVQRNHSGWTLCAVELGKHFSVPI